MTEWLHFHALEKEMATHSSVLAWRIPGMGEPGGLPSMGLHRVWHNWSDLAAAAAYVWIMLYFIFWILGTIATYNQNIYLEWEWTIFRHIKVFTSNTYGELRCLTLC